MTPLTGAIMLAGLYVAIIGIELSQIESHKRWIVATLLFGQLLTALGGLVGHFESKFNR